MPKAAVHLVHKLMGPKKKKKNNNNNNKYTVDMKLWPGSKKINAEC